MGIKETLLRDMETLHIAKTLEIKKAALNKQIFTPEGAEAYLTNYEFKRQAADCNDYNPWLQTELNVFNVKTGMTLDLAQYKDLILRIHHKSTKFAKDLSLKVNIFRGMLEDKIAAIDETKYDAGDTAEVAKVAALQSVMNGAVGLNRDTTLEQIQAFFG